MIRISPSFIPAIAAALVLAAACQREEAAAPVPTQPAEQAQPAPVPGVPPVAEPTPAPAAEAQASDKWREYAKPDDADRLKRLDAAWAKAMEGVKKDGDEAEFAELGALGDPKVALERPHPGPGLYRCRTVKLGRFGMIAYPWFKCEVSLTPGGDLVLNKLTGSQRSTGNFYPDSDTRLVFLGAQAWGATELKAPEYGNAPERDQIGVLERIGPQRWRLALPWPRVESDLDLVELAK